ncbi:SGNH/GDSL hydrolase family protein [Dictyobacter arantiisoli]|uniref:Lysophospholipase n=1 Tax=Dictyobacter arantiisoli TaxID=2014874 RepID=A0A5A5TDD0_9CHLR|nr:SGNH/GDSL hydrolase family protein [Dictyobacter arantiisoli]GCF09039.1 lysophospholipase [Dictyobacter arantiisoli]
MLTACAPITAPLLSIPLQTAPHTHITYVAIGASDTFGTGADDPATQCWPADLLHKLGSDARLINLGVPGITTHDVLTIELPVALDTHANLITVWLAVNDLVDQVPVTSYRQDLTSLLQRLRVADPQAQIAVANVPDLTLLPRYQQSDVQALRSTILAYNAAIASAVQQKHIRLVDLYQQWQSLAGHPEYISDDGFHPNERGYAQVAAIFYHSLQIDKA